MFGSTETSWIGTGPKGGKARKPRPRASAGRALPEPEPSLSQDESQWIRRAQAGDMAAFERLVEPHAGFVYNLALRLLGDAQEAEDLAQEALLRAWKGLPRFRAEARFRTWLYRIVTNLCYNRLPRLKADLQALDPDDAALALPDGRQKPDRRLLTGELRARLHGAIEDLPDPYRMLITLRHLQELSYAEIADVTGMPLGTVKTGIHRGRKRLQAVLSEDMEGRPSPADRNKGPDGHGLCAEAGHA